MKLSYLAAALLVSSAVYLGGMLAFSSYNPRAYDDLETHVERLERNVAELRTLNRTLVARAELYRRSSDAVAVQARRLQYYSPGQEVIRLRNPDGSASAESPGAIVRRPPASSDYRAYVRVAAAVAFFLTIAASLVMEAGGGRSAHVMRRASR